MSQFFWYIIIKGTPSKETELLSVVAHRQDRAHTATIRDTLQTHTDASVCGEVCRHRLFSLLLPWLLLLLRLTPPPSPRFSVGRGRIEHPSLSMLMVPTPNRRLCAVVCSTLQFGSRRLRCCSRNHTHTHTHTDRARPGAVDTYLTASSLWSDREEELRFRSRRRIDATALRLWTSLPLSSSCRHHRR